MIPKSASSRWSYLTLLVAVSVLSSGFVYGGIGKRRSRAGRLEHRLALEAATERLVKRSRGWRAQRHRRRSRANGWADAGEVTLDRQHYAFGPGGQQTITARLSSSTIQSTMQRYNQQIGTCLITHGASDVTIHLDILGTGHVKVVTTDLAGAAARCVKSIVKNVRFPRSKAPRSTGNYRLKIQ